MKKNNLLLIDKLANEYEEYYKLRFRYYCDCCILWAYANICFCIRCNHRN
uniref:Uncharacterized protein n=1 Tax=Rhizophora mucronata TaxID=61149 RepID=A0A2P2MCZ5_RHIMU